MTATTTSSTDYLLQEKQVIVEPFVNKHHLSPTNDDTDIINKIPAFSDDDSACSYDSLEEDDSKLMTPPLSTSQHVTQHQLKEQELIQQTHTVLHETDWEFWSKVVADHHQFTALEIKQLSFQIQHGIPSALRGTVWPILAKMTDIEQYIELLKQESVYEKAITRDLHRTFPHHPFFQSSVGQEALFNVVKAYSNYDPEVGYCQGIAFVAGPLLLHMPEEEAFSILVQLMQRYELRGHYTPQLDLLRQRLFQFDGLLLDHLPHVHRHFNEQGVRSNMYASQWFLTLYAYKFPLDVVYRIYDTLFTEGVDCLFRIGLALLAKNQSILLSLEFEALVTYLKDDMLTIYKDNITDLLSESFQIQISKKRLDRLAKEHQIETIKADTEASVIESLRKKNRLLSEQFKSLENENKQVKEEHARVAEQLVQKKQELARIYDENDALKQKTIELRKVIQVLPSQIEDQVQSDMEKLCLKNQTLNQKNAQLQDQLADLESLVIEMKLKYAQSESDRYTLNQKLSDLKKCMNM
ncbi:GTPase-activating protein [Rhizopus stolonifer]|uniref:GTPase-activating protein n=1 Tax=Rhizopus stolonifer TaxID=4846 RepID=A0A367KLB2_RHIST|nr:GTPase-activating protein [Rhizopus stolonifer]